MLKDPDPEFCPAGESSIVFVIKSLPVALLGTCRQINDEARPFLAPKLERLRAEPTRFIVDSTSMKSFMHERVTCVLDLVYVLARNCRLYGQFDPPIHWYSPWQTQGLERWLSAWPLIH